MSDDEAVAVDTSVAVPLLLSEHEHHRAVAEWAKGRTLRLAGHALAETYAVLTRLPGDARVTGSDAVELIDDSFAGALVCTPETAGRVHRELERSGVSGGATYDAMVALAARDHDAVLATRDARARGTYEAIGVSVEMVAVAGG